MSEAHRRRGRKRALVAVGHTLLVIIYHVLQRGTTYQWSCRPAAP